VPSSIIEPVPHDETTHSLIRRTAWSGLVLVAGWLVFKGLDLGGGALWSALRTAGGPPLALAGVFVALMVLSIALGVAAGRVSLPLARVRIWTVWLTRHTPYAIRDLASGRRVGKGTDNHRWSTQEEFEEEDPRRIGSSDQLHSDFGHWRNSRSTGGLRVSFIHSTCEVVAVDLASDGQPVELLGYARDHHHAAHLIDGWSYVHELRWVRYRLRGWRVPLPPYAQWWQEFDRRPPIAWPSPPPPSVGRMVGAYYGRHGDDHKCVVEIVDEAGRRELYHAVDSSPTGLAWGYGGAGPTDMSRSVLLDRLGYVPNPEVVGEFRDSVVAKLEARFVLKFEEVDAWINAHGFLFAEDPRAEPLDPFAAGGAD
jgi:hypothetical protein